MDKKAALERTISVGDREIELVCPIYFARENAGIEGYCRERS